MPRLSFALAILPIAVLLAAPACAADDAYLCQVTASRRIELAAPVAGTIEKMLVDRGDKVTTGQPVAQLRADLERVELALAEAHATAVATLRARQSRLAFTGRKLERNVDLAKTNMVSQNDLDSMRTDRDVAAQDVVAAEEALRQAQLELKRAQAALEMRMVRSPINGVVTERRSEPGEMVRDQPVMVVQQTDPLYVELGLPVDRMDSVKPGTEVRLVFDVPGVAPVTAHVTLVDTVIDPASNTFGVRITLPNQDGAIPAGGKCRARFAQ
jgi:RND family efflux transporter MFP subunit